LQRTEIILSMTCLALMAENRHEGGQKRPTDSLVLSFLLVNVCSSSNEAGAAARVELFDAASLADWYTAILST